MSAERPSPRPSTVAANRLAAADRAENDCIAVLHVWRREWDSALAAALKLALAIHRRDFTEAWANFEHLEIFFPQKRNDREPGILTVVKGGDCHRPASG